MYFCWYNHHRSQHTLLHWPQKGIKKERNNGKCFHKVSAITYRTCAWSLLLQPLQEACNCELRACAPGREPALPCPCLPSPLGHTPLPPVRLTMHGHRRQSRFNFLFTILCLGQLELEIKSLKSRSLDRLNSSSGPFSAEYSQKKLSLTSVHLKDNSPVHPCAERVLSCQSHSDIKGEKDPGREVCISFSFAS